LAPFFTLTIVFTGSSSSSLPLFHFSREVHKADIFIEEEVFLIVQCFIDQTQTLEDLKSMILNHDFKSNFA
jgi:hypothetical protein